MPKFISIDFLQIKLSFFKFRNYSFLRSRSSKLYEFCHLFNGALIKSETIKKIGNVNKDYFLYGDEVDYYYRLKKVGVLVTLINSLHFHPPRSNTRVSSSWVFYTLKNTIINNFKYRKFPNIYNLAIIILILYRILVRNGFIQFLSYILGKKSKFYYMAIVLGYKKAIGINVPN